MTKKLSARVKRHRARIRRDPYGRMALAFADYLKTVGWNMVVVGKVHVVSRELTEITPGAFGRYTAMLEFSGGKFITTKGRPTK
jgi:hypothetical protein